MFVKVLFSTCSRAESLRVTLDTFFRQETFESMRDNFVDAGLKRRRQDAAEKPAKRLKRTAKSNLFLGRRIFSYLCPRLFGDPAAAMHHQCRMYFFAARNWHSLQPERTRP